MTQEYTRVTFKVSCTTTDTERVVIAGSDPALGGWDPLRRGVKLTESSDKLWSVTVSLRTGKRYEYKYFIVEKEDSDTATLFSKSPGPQSLRGETFDINRKLTTSGQAMEISDGVFNQSAAGESRIKVIERIVDQAERVLIIALYRLPIISQRDSAGRLVCPGHKTFGEGLINRNRQGTGASIGMTTLCIQLPSDFGRVSAAERSFGLGS